MAEFEAIGKALQIPQSVLNNIEKIDQKINLIASDSEKMATHFTSAMTRMGNGADGLLKKLQAIQGVINGLGSVNTGGLGNVGKGMGNTATQAEKVAASISEAASALNRFVQTWKGSGRVTSMLDSLATREQVNLLRELNNQAMQTSRTLTQMNRENSLEARKKANETKIASQEETNATNRKMEALKRENSQTKINTAEYRNYVSALTMSEGTENSRIKKIERMNTVLSELQRKEALYANEIEIVRKKIEQLTRENDSLARSREKTKKQNIDERANTQALNAYNRAMAASEALVTQRINKIAKLRQAEEMLRNASGNYATQLNRISQEIARLNRLNEGQVDSYGRVIRSQRNLINTSQQLTRQLALLFSVSQIEGYISKLIQVRGEFELQQTALASILQNKDEADQLFGQITELAVRSPFTIKELTTYSKSLAAYQVEYEDLYDTLKMLADVSSGLGVDMQRLILAFGQVKAANFLRGTETRQFTEAGINMLGELSKYYSELEGRIVSVTEVQDRQFKRMISFQDVEEVFKRLTSAGGMFYNMQEKQAETLRGQMMNLQDQIDLMLNDIGKSNQSTISTIISLVKSVIENWRTIAQVMEPIASILVLYLTATKGWGALVGNLPKIWKSIQTNVLLAVGSITKAEAAQRGFNNATRLNAWLAIGAVVATIIWEVVNAIQAANAEQKELNKTLSEGYDNAVTMSTNYKRLANTVTDATASYDEQEKALEELKRTYSDILPQHYLEADAIRAMKGNYDEATSAIYNYIQAKTQEKQLQIISENEGADLADSQQDLAKDLQDQLKTQNNYNISLSESNAILNKFKDVFEERVLKGGEQALGVYKELVSTMTGIDESELSFRTAEFGQYVTDLRQYLTAVENVKDSTNTAFADWITRDLNEQEKVLEDKIKQVRSLLNTISHEGEVGEDGALITQKQVDDAKEKLIQITSSWGVESSKIQNLTGSAFEIKQATIDFTVSAYQSLLKKLANTKFEPDQQASVNKFMEDLQKRIDSFDATPFENYMSEIIQAAATANSISLDGVMDVFARTNETVDEYRKRLKGIIDQLQSDLADYAKSPYLVAMWTGNPQAAAEAQKKLLVAQTAYSAVNVGETTGGKGNSENDRLKEQIRLIQEAGKEYEKYRKLYDEPMSQQLTGEAFTQAFKDVGLSVDMEFDVNGVIEGIRKVISTAGVEGQKIGNEAIAKLMTDTNAEQRTKEVEEYRKQIDELFASLSNYQELEKLGLNKDLISQLFGIDVSSINDVQTAFDKMKNILKGYGNEGEKVIADAEKKITDAQQKELKDRLAQYAEFMRNSISERARIEIEAQREIAKIQSTQGMTQPMKDASIQNVRQQANAKISQLDWQDFQNSDVYTQLFQDLEYVSTSALKRIKENLDALKDSMSSLTPEQLKSINEYYSKLEEQLSTRNPFAAMRDSLKEIRELQSEGRTEEVINQELLNYEAQAELYKTQIEDLETIIGMKQEGMSLDSLSDDLLQRNADILDKTTDELRLQLSLRKGQLNQVQTNIGISQKDLNSYGKARKDADILGNTIKEIGSLGKQAFGSISSILDSMGVSMGENEDAVGGLIDGFLNIAMQLGQLAILCEIFGVALNAALGPIGWAVMALQALTSIFTAFSKIHDNKREQQIEKEQEAVEYLEKAYDKLYDTIENGLSIYSYSDNSKLIDNLRRQVESYQRMIAAEQDKKKTDEDRIKEWENAIDDVYSQIDELYNNIKEDLVGNFKDVSSQLAEALVGAFESGEDAAEAWGNSVRDIMVEILTNILSMKFIEPAVQEILDNLFEQAMPQTDYASKIDQQLQDARNELAQMEAEGADMSNGFVGRQEWYRKKAQLEKEIQQLEKEYDKANQAAEGEIPNITEDIVDSTAGQLNDLLESVVDSPIADLIKQLYGQSGTGGDTLTGLQRGIESITHEQSDALQALLESLRFFVSDENAVIHNIYNTLTMPTEENPFLSELRVQTEQLRLMYNLWNGVIKNQGGSGRAVNVRIV